MTPDFVLYDKLHYLQELARSARNLQPGDSMTVMAMPIDTTSVAVHDMCEALAEAARRGVAIRLIVDAMSFMLHDNDRVGTVFLYGQLKPERMRGSFLETYRALEKIKSAGGDYKILNMPSHAFSFPYAGRSHIKLALINDRIFIGGCNLDHEDYLDVMASWRNSPTAESLRQLVDTIVDDGNVRHALDDTDQTLVLGDSMRIFIDAGVPGKSTILSEAYALIDSAKEHITLTCQYFPGGDTAQRLLDAHRRGVKVTVHYSHYSVQGKAGIAHAIYRLREKLRLPKEFFIHQLPPGTPKLHAKILISESTAMLGSHNYVTAGVRFGTAEIAMRSTDKTFVERLQQYTDTLVSPIARPKEQ